MDTIKDGRLDIVIFANGGREFIARIPSEPETPEALYLPEVAKFVEAHQRLEKPEKFTAIYSVKDDEISISWGEWQGEIEREEPVFDFPEMLPEA